MTCASCPLTIHGVKDLLVVVGGIGDIPYVASTTDLLSWDIHEADLNVLDPLAPLTGLIEYDTLVVGVTGANPGIVVYQQETN